mmetsp:Transcript_7135/g.20621  ORF Transcript_7135/g.20621 Transcript_7135/m.20621 type:complete len:212 (-) Transcript_7135:2119-2754(-)
MPINTPGLSAAAAVARSSSDTELELPRRPRLLVSLSFPPLTTISWCRRHLTPTCFQHSMVPPTVLSQHTQGWCSLSPGADGSKGSLPSDPLLDLPPGCCPIDARPGGIVSLAKTELMCCDTAWKGPAAWPAGDARSAVALRHRASAAASVCMRTAPRSWARGGSREGSLAAASTSFWIDALPPARRPPPRWKKRPRNPSLCALDASMGAGS